MTQSPPEIVTYGKSMTKRLAEDSGCKPIILARKERIAPAHARDSQLIGVKTGQWLWQREILMGNQQVWLYGFTMTLPVARCASLWDLHHIGTKPLGAKLFTTKHVFREYFAVGEIAPQHNLWQKIRKMKPDIPEKLWARCSLFSYQLKPLLLYEVLLPDCPGMRY